MRKSKFNVTTTAEFISEATKIHNGKYAYDKSVFTALSKHVIITCLKHGCWDQLANAHLSGHGCFKCMREALEASCTLKNKDLDRFLVEKNKQFKRIGEYKKANDPLEFECLNCAHKWFSKPDIIKTNKNSSCPKCYIASITHSNKYVDDKLIENNIQIKRISNYINKKTKIKWQCLKCEHQWFYLSGDVMYGRKQCSVCIGTHHNNKYVDNKLIEQNRNIKRIGEYIDLSTKIDWQCMDCCHVWTARPISIIGESQGPCPQCSPYLRYQQYVKTTMEKLGLKIERIVIKLHNRKLYPDFYIPKYNLIIEYNGRQHYEKVNFGNISDKEAIDKFQKQQIRDQLLRDYCFNNSINLLEIDGRKYKPKKLIKFINDYFANLELSPLPFPPKPLIPSSELQII